MFGEFLHKKDRQVLSSEDFLGPASAREINMDMYSTTQRSGSLPG